MLAANEQGIAKLYIEPASGCNLNCTMCFRNEWVDEPKGVMADVTFDRLFAAIRCNPPRLVVFGGMGEPMLHPRLSEWVSRLHGIGCRTELITNGTLLTAEMSFKLLRAGLDRVWISMEGFCRQAYERTRKGSIYDALLENIESYNRERERSMRGELGITFVMLVENMPELNRFNAFADQYRVDAINVSHALPIAPAKREEVIFWDGYPTGTMRRWHTSFTPRKADYCRFVAEANFFVRWDGEVAPCMQLLHECHTYLYKERRRIHRPNLGNVNELDLKEIWRSPAYVAFRERVIAFDFPSCTLCDGCDDRLSNEADCDFNPFPTCGACLWAQGIVYCP